MLDEPLLLRQKQLFRTLVGQASTRRPMLVTVVAAVAASLALLPAKQVLRLALLDGSVTRLLLTRHRAIAGHELIPRACLRAAHLTLTTSHLLARVLVPDDLGDALLSVGDVLVAATQHLPLVHHTILLLDLSLVRLVQQLTRVDAVACRLLHRRLARRYTTVIVLIHLL